MLTSAIEDGKKAISERSYLERFFLIFWLLGPFILLIERSPADFWLTLLSVAFVCRAIKCRDGHWLTHYWVRAAFVFWGICLLSAVLYPFSSNNIGEAFVWFRFPLFAMATAFWLGADKRLLYLMLISTAMALLLMCGILLAEIVLEGFKPRLSWPYDDMVPGNYLAKVGLPVVVFALALCLSSRGWRALFFGSFCLLIIGMTLITGERINFLILLCAAFLTTIIWEPNWKKRFVAFTTVLLIPTLILALFPDVFVRFVTAFLDQLPLSPKSPYYRAMVPAWLIFEQYPLLGIGPGNFRYFCADLIAPLIGSSADIARIEAGLSGAFDLKFGFDQLTRLECQNHPHNFYLQILSETGILGGISALIFIGLIIFRCFRTRIEKHHVLYTTAWVIPFALFWPIKSNADFFGQWNNIFLWSAVALALAISHLKSTAPK